MNGISSDPRATGSEEIAELRERVRALEIRPDRIERGGLVAVPREEHKTASAIDAAPARGRCQDHRGDDLLVVRSGQSFKRGSTMSLFTYILFTCVAAIVVFIITPRLSGDTLTSAMARR